MNADAELLTEAGAARREMGERLKREVVKGRTKKQADRHYQAIADAEVARIRASATDAPPAIKAQGVCLQCGRDIIRFGRGWAHLDCTADHPAEVKRSAPEGGDAS